MTEQDVLHNILILLGVLVSISTNYYIKFIV